VVNEDGEAELTPQGTPVMVVPSQREDAPSAGIGEAATAAFRDKIVAAATSTQLRDLHAEARQLGFSGSEAVTDEQGNPTTLSDLIIARGRAAKDAEDAAATEPVDAEVVDTPAAPVETDPADAVEPIGAAALVKIRGGLARLGARSVPEQIQAATALLGHTVPDDALTNLSADQGEALLMAIGVDGAADRVAQALRGPAS
jgi:hypothetical protein